MQYHIGALHEDGHGVSRDYLQAMEWYRKAAEQGCSVVLKRLHALSGQDFVALNSKPPKRRISQKTTQISHSIVEFAHTHAVARSRVVEKFHAFMKKECEEGK